MSRLPRITRMLAASTVAAFAMIATATPAHATNAGTGPLQDSQVTGNLTFCNRANQPVTAGSLLTAPFVWKAISSVAAPGTYSATTGRATLAAYQPLKFVDPGDWSGSQLTGSSAFSNASHPVAQATNGDGPLLNFVQAYPPHYKGLVEIRMIYSGVNLPNTVDAYPAATLKVTGMHWKLVAGGGGDCGAGTGVSDESTLLPKGRLKHQQHVVLKGSKASSGHDGASKASRQHGGATRQPTAPSTNTSPTPVANATDSGTGGSRDKTAIGLGAIAVVGVAALAITWWRRRSVSAR